LSQPQPLSHQGGYR